MIGSPWYWAIVGAATLFFAIVDLIALSRREMGRAHGFALAVYLSAWVVVVGLGLPIAPLGSLWWVFPAAIRIAAAVIFGGGQLLAEALRAERRLVHHEHH